MPLGVINHNFTICLGHDSLVCTMKHGIIHNVLLDVKIRSGHTLIMKIIGNGSIFLGGSEKRSKKRKCSKKDREALRLMSREHGDHRRKADDVAHETARRADRRTLHQTVVPRLTATPCFGDHAETTIDGDNSAEVKSEF